MRVRTTERATTELLNAVRRKGRTIALATPGSEELRYLDTMDANANVGGERLDHIIVREDVRKVEVVEEFLHGTQQRLGIVARVGVIEAEIHVKRFMIEHRRLLGISAEDVRILEAMIGN